MAFVANNQVPEQEQNLTAPSGTTTSNPLANIPPAQTGGSSGTTPGGGAPNTASPKQFGSSATNLGAYLTENAPQVQGQANTIAGNLNNTYGQVSGDLSNAANNFNQQVASSYTAPNQQLLSQEQANPTAFAGNAGNVSAFQSQLNDVYNGPQNFESTTPYSQVQNEVGQAVTNAGLWNSPAGITSAYQQAEPNATPGITSLDASLLQGSPGAMSTVQQAAQPFQNLTGYLANDITAADQGVTNAQQAAQQANTAANAQLTGQVSGLNAQETADNQAAFTAANTQYQNLENELAGYAPSAAEQALMNQVNTELAPGSGQGGTAQTNANQQALLADIAQQFPIKDLSNVATTGGTPVIANNGQPNLDQILNLERQLETPKFVASANQGNGSAWTPSQYVDLSQFLSGSAPTQSQFTGATPQDIAEAQALNTLSGTQATQVPNATGNTYNPVTFNQSNALTALQNALTGVNAQTQGEAAQIAAQQQARHVASEGKGLFSNVGKDLSAVFPVTALANYLAPSAIKKEV
jgi:hypothetical protein